MRQFSCMGCGYVYDEEKGSPGQRVPNYNALLKTGCGWHKGQDSTPVVPVPAGTKWEDVPDTYICPSCGAGKDMFE